MTAIAILSALRAVSISNRQSKRYWANSKGNPHLFASSVKLLQHLSITFQTVYKSETKTLCENSLMYITILSELSSSTQDIPHIIPLHDFHSFIQYLECHTLDKVTHLRSTFTHRPIHEGLGCSIHLWFHRLMTKILSGTVSSSHVIRMQS